MPGVKVVHCADVHLDSSFAGAGLRSTAAQHRAEDLKETFARMIHLARDENADVLLIAGDLFEHDFIRKPTILYVTDLIAGVIPDIPVFIAPGNHDPLQPDSYYKTIPWPANVTIFGPQWTSVDLPALGATIHGWGFDRPRVTERHLAQLRVPPSEWVQIVLLHGSDERFPSDEGTYLPLNREECLACGADYIALGHFHSHGVVAERDGHPVAQYPGTPESLSFGQSGRHGVVVGTVTKAGNQMRLVQVGQREHVSINVDVSGAATLEQAVTRIRDAAPANERALHFYRFTLTGEVDPDLNLDPDILSRRLEGDFQSVALIDRTAPALDLLALAREQSLRGRFVQRVLAALEDAVPEKEEELRLTLRYGLQALEGRR